VLIELPCFVSRPLYSWMYSASLDCASCFGIEAPDVKIDRFAERTGTRCLPLLQIEGDVPVVDHGCRERFWKLACNLLMTVPRHR